MQEKDKQIEKHLMEQMEGLIKSIKSIDKSIQEKDLALKLGYSAGYISECRSKKKVSEKFVNKLADHFRSLENPKPEAASDTSQDYSQPIIQVVLNLTYIGKKNADSMDRMTISMDKMADSNLQNSKSIATLVNLIATNSDLASLLASPQADPHKDDGLPAEAFVGGHSLTPGKKKQPASKD